MGIVRMGCPEELILQMKTKFNIEEFIETGTYKGNTCIWATRHFDTVQTIENSKIIFDKYADKLGKYNNIKRHFGNSSELLKEVIDSNKTQVFWLDAHWCGGDTYGDDDECPLLEELDLLKNNTHENSIILVDDARLFLSPPYLPHVSKNWPTIHDITDKLSSTHYVAIFEDVIFIGSKKNEEEYIHQLQLYTTNQFNLRKKRIGRLTHKLLHYATLVEQKIFG
ncbi:MAG: hypothetical protein JXQ96_09115 [Cyclobacteriaceae bacterium]